MASCVALRWVPGWKVALFLSLFLILSRDLIFV